MQSKIQFNQENNWNSAGEPTHTCLRDLQEKPLFNIK
jgi:hypothetical protein